jgi:hypothetical protein
MHWPPDFVGSLLVIGIEKLSSQLQSQPVISRTAFQQKQVVVPSERAGGNPVESRPGFLTETTARAAVSVGPFLLPTFNAVFSRPS